MLEGSNFLPVCAKAHWCALLVNKCATGIWIIVDLYISMASGDVSPQLAGWCALAMGHEMKD